MNQEKSKRKKKRGSILVYSLILMFAILSLVVGLTKITVTKQKTTSDTAQSSQAFQVANSGVEKVLQELKNKTGKISDAVENCNDKKTTFNNLGGGTSTIVYLDEDGNKLDCDASISQIDRIKSTGEIAQTKRAIEVAMAGTENGISGGCIVETNSAVSNNGVKFRWGNGCKSVGTLISNPNVDNGFGCEEAEDDGYNCGSVSSNENGNNVAHCLCVSQ